MTKFTHKIIVRYRFSDGDSTSNVMKLARSETEARAKETGILAELTQLGRVIVSTEILQTKGA